jgi:hypothetical protein
MSDCHANSKIAAIQAASSGAKGASHTSLGHRPRNVTEKRHEGCRPGSSQSQREHVQFTTEQTNRAVGAQEGLRKKPMTLKWIAARLLCLYGPWSGD